MNESESEPEPVLVLPPPSRKKVNHGPCKVCGKPILYLACRYCGPRCNMLDVQTRITDEAGDYVEIVTETED
jgi:endogenous inhibitor of DNA gyrase (YacG/DUF329 family)